MSHAYSRLHYHLVFSTKDRKRLFVPEIKDRLYAYMNGIIRNLDGVVEEIGGVDDHVHILFFSPPKHALSDVIRDLKANSSAWIHETWPERAAFAWQRGYGIFTVSESNVEVVRAYIRNQEEHHRQMTFEDEYLALLRKHSIEYDLRYVFD
jgi:REP element-mobilizing transposase RayT